MYKTGCALALMVISSLFGSLLCFRYNTAYHDAVLILIVAAVFPGILAVLLFTAIWCTCIRPTLYYRRAFGRGPLIKVPAYEESSDQPVTASDDQQPWAHHQLVDSDSFDQPVAFHLEENRLSYPNDEWTHDQVNYVGTTEFGTSSLQTLVHSENMTVDGDSATASVSRRKWWSCRDQRSNQLFSLRPRRLARLPPILPATFIIIAYLTYLTGETFRLTDSVAAYLAFVICMSIIILAIFCVFKNFVAWLVLSVVLGLITLCMIRLKDARELSVATRIQLQSDIPIISQQNLAVSTGVIPGSEDQPLLLGMTTSGSTSGPLPLWKRGAPIFVRSSFNIAAGGAAPHDTVSLSMADSSATNVNIGAVGRPVGGELQPLLAK